MIRTLFHLLSILLLTIFMRPVAISANDEKPIISKDASCIEDATYRYCTSAHGLYKVTTASDTENIISNGHICISQIDLVTGSVLREDCNTFSYHALFKDGEILEEGAHQRAVSQIGDITCINIGNLHYAQGEVRYESTSFSCT